MPNKPLVAPKSAGGDFELVPPGVYLASCYRMVDIGTQDQSVTIAGKKVEKQARKLILWWEIIEEDGKPVKMEDGTPFVISQRYTFSMHKKARLRQDLDSWRGRPFTEAEAGDFDITKLLGQTCLMQVVHNESGDRTYANIDAIMTTKKEATPVNPLVSFSLDDPDQSVFENLPDWVKQLIQDSPEFRGAPSAEAADSSDAPEPKGDEIDIADVKF